MFLQSGPAIRYRVEFRLDPNANALKSRANP